MMITASVQAVFVNDCQVSVLTDFQAVSLSHRIDSSVTTLFEVGMDVGTAVSARACHFYATEQNT